jgi:hypothetical protein
MPYSKKGLGERCPCDGHRITPQHLKRNCHLEYEEMCKYIQNVFQSFVSQGSGQKPDPGRNEPVSVSRSR